MIRIALAIVRLFGHGGLQRDCMAIARRLIAEGHDVEIVCASADNPPTDIAVTVLPVRLLTNHGRNAQFSRQLARHVASRFDVVAGFDALENLEILYCANPPARLRGVLDRFTPRKRTLLRLEHACFGTDSRTQLLLLSDAQRAAYDARWHMDAGRITVIPPTIARERLLPPEQRGEFRDAVRRTLNIANDQTIWLFVGSFPQTKGLDRLIAALPFFADVLVLSVGQNESDAAIYRVQADRLGVASRLMWLGIRDDISALMAASDLLVHPARLDVTGTVILEAIGNGLPVITTAACGYASHVIAAGAGRVIDEPFAQEAFVAALRAGADRATRASWQAGADRYSETTDLTSGLDVAARRIAAAAR